MKYVFKNSELETLWLLVQNKSISNTSEQTGIAQANLSRLLTSIEEKMGFTIFDRSYRPLRLTVFGEQLLPVIEQILRSHNDLKSFIEGYQTKPEGQVIIHATVGLLMLLTKHIVPIIRTHYPEIELKLKVTNLGDNGYIRGAEFPDESDMLLTHAHPQNESLVARKICCFRNDVYASPNYIATHPVNTVLDYASFNCIQYNFMGIKPNIWSFTEQETSNEVKITINGNIVCDNLFIALASSAGGYGFVLAPNYSVSLFGMSDQLLPTLPKGITNELPCYLIYKKREGLPYRAQVIINCITQTLSDFFENDYIL